MPPDILRVLGALAQTQSTSLPWQTRFFQARPFYLSGILDESGQQQLHKYWAVSMRKETSKFSALSVGKGHVSQLWGRNQWQCTASQLPWAAAEEGASFGPNRHAKQVICTQPSENSLFTCWKEVRGRTDRQAPMDMCSDASVNPDVPILSTRSPTVHFTQVLSFTRDPNCDLHSTQHRQLAYLSSRPRALQTA